MGRPPPATASLRKARQLVPPGMRHDISWVFNGNKGPKLPSETSPSYPFSLQRYEVSFYRYTVPPKSQGRRCPGGFCSREFEGTLLLPLQDTGPWTLGRFSFKFSQEPRTSPCEPCWAVWKGFCSFSLTLLGPCSQQAWMKPEVVDQTNLLELDHVPSASMTEAGYRG